MMQSIKCHNRDMGKIYKNTENVLIGNDSPSLEGVGSDFIEPCGIFHICLTLFPSKLIVSLPLKMPWVSYLSCILLFICLTFSPICLFKFQLALKIQLKPDFFLEAFTDLQTTVLSAPSELL